MMALTKITLCEHGLCDTAGVFLQVMTAMQASGVSHFLTILQNLSV